MNKLVNLTPHALRILDKNGRLDAEVPRSGTVARVDVDYTDDNSIQLGDTDEFGIQVFTCKYSKVIGLPEPCAKLEGIIYVTSTMVAQAVKREDVYSPGKLVRDEDGNPIGCEGLVRHA